MRLLTVNQLYKMTNTIYRGNFNGHLNAFAFRDGHVLAHAQFTWMSAVSGPEGRYKKEPKYLKY